MQTKSFFQTVVFVACFMAAASLMSSCTDTNPPSTGGEETQEKPAVEAFMNYQLITTQEMLNVFDFFIEYYDDKGQVQSETLAATEWKKSGRSALPATFGYRVKLAVKEGVDVDTISSLTASYKYGYFASAIDEDEEKVGQPYTYTNSYNVPYSDNDRVQYFVNKYTQGYLIKARCEFNEKGEWTATGSAWE